MKTNELVVMFMDKTCTIMQVKEPQFLGLSKHIELRYHFTRKKAE